MWFPTLEATRFEIRHFERKEAPDDFLRTTADPFTMPNLLVILCNVAATLISSSVMCNRSDQVVVRETETR